LDHKETPEIKDLKVLWATWDHKVTQEKKDQEDTEEIEETTDAKVRKGMSDRKVTPEIKDQEE